MNGNPYYTGSPIPDLGKNIVDLMRLKLGQDEQAMRNRSALEQERVNRIMYGTGEPGQEGYTPGLHQQKAALDAIKTERAAPEHQQTFGFREATKINAFLSKKFGLSGSDVQKEIIRMAADPKVDNMTAYDNFKTNWKEWRQEVIEKSSAKLQKALEDDPEYLEKPVGKEHAMYLDALSQDESADLVDKFFEGPLTSAATARAAEEKKNWLVVGNQAVNLTTGERIAQPPKEVNVANEIDTILGGLFKGYYTDPAVRQKALDWYATPEGSAAVQRAAMAYSQGKQAPQFAPVQTTGGILPFATKGPKAGTFVQPPGGIPAPTKPLPEAAAKEFGALAALRAQVGEAKRLYNSRYVGPVAGRYYSVAENLVNLPPEQVQFYAYVNDIKDALLRARSGAQINEQEYARLVKFLPTAELPPQNFMARMKRFDKAVEMIQREKAKTYSAQGYQIDVSLGAKEDPGKKKRFEIIEVK